MPVKNVVAVRLGLNTGKMNKSKVCRCLFGMPDHAELKKELDAELKKIDVDVKQRWNFDTVLDQPLNGRYEWSLEPDAPSFYTRPYRPSKFVNKRIDLCNSESSDSDSDNTDNGSSPVLSAAAARLTETSNSAEDEKAEAIDMKRENETTPEARVIRQTRISDFMRKRKRLSEGSENEEGRAVKTLRL